MSKMIEKAKRSKILNNIKPNESLNANLESFLGINRV